MPRPFYLPVNHNLGLVNNPQEKEKSMFSMGLIHHLPGPKSMVSFIRLRARRDLKRGPGVSWCRSQQVHAPSLAVTLLCTQNGLSPLEPPLFGGKHHQQPGWSVLEPDPRASAAANGALRTSAQATTSIQGALDRGALKAGMKRQ